MFALSPCRLARILRRRSVRFHHAVVVPAGAARERASFVDPRRRAAAAGALSPSPVDWRDEVIYFLLPDRFSDGQEDTRPRSIPASRVARPPGFRWDRWAQSGGERWQGGTIAGLRRRSLSARLGVTTLWLGPVFKQRRPHDTYHGYAIQDFLDVDPRFGSRGDLVALVAAAHAPDFALSRRHLQPLREQLGLPGDVDQPPFRPWPWFYAFGRWRTGAGGFDAIGGSDDGVWPQELQPDDVYTRAGTGGLGAGDFDDPHAEFRRTDFVDLRDVNYDGSRALDDLARCYKYWIALTDCDGFRIDTLKHVDAETGRNFCGAIKEFAANLGKADFFLVGEIAGDDCSAERYREVLGTNLNATLDIGASRRSLHAVAKGLAPPHAYFDFVRRGTTTSARIATPAGSTCRSSTTTITCRATRCASRATRRAIIRWSRASRCSCFASAFRASTTAPSRRSPVPSAASATNICPTTTPATRRRTSICVKRCSARSIRAGPAPRASAMTQRPRCRPAGLRSLRHVGCARFDPHSAAFVRIAHSHACGSGSRPSLGAAVSAAGIDFGRPFAAAAAGS